MQSQPQTDLGHARNEEDENGKPGHGREEFIHKRRFREI